MDLYSKYSDIILNSFLRIREGDSLSVNTEESDFEFAKIIADKAVKVTKTVAKIVITDKGRPSEVVDFDPYGTAVPQTGFCMLHLQHSEVPSVEKGEVLDVLVEKDDMGAIQKLGHLADPVIFDRRITIPWCVVPSYGANNPLLKETVEKLGENVDDLILSADYRKKILNNYNIVKLHFYSDYCDFTLVVPEKCGFVGGSYTLPNGRKYVNGPDFQNLMCNVDKNSLDGRFDADCMVLGRSVHSEFVFERGCLKSYTENGKLREFLSFDSDICLPGYVSLADRCFSISFGGALVDSVLEQPDADDELPEWLNDSLFRFSCVLDEKLNIDVIDSSNTKHEIIRNGFFLE